MALLVTMFFTVACSFKKEVLVRPVSGAKPAWFSTGKTYQHTDIEGELMKHLFFDFTPYIDIENNLVDVVLLTPLESAHQYDIDLVSGQRFYSHSYCEEKDVWGVYDDKLRLPPFTEAFIPRLLDQSKKPQRVIVFGQTKFLQTDKFPKEEQVKVRIVGGTVEQFCDKFPCRRQEKWTSKLVLFAVSTLDPEFREVNSLKTLKSKVDWAHVKSFLENRNGRTITSGGSYPAYRLLGDVAGDRAFRFAIERGHLFSSKELKTLRKSCEAVYNKMWTMKEQVDKDEVTLKDSVIDFYENYINPFSTCIKYVKTPSINSDVAKHWFFEYYKAFIYAREYGHVYICDQGSWVRNLKSKNGKPRFDEWNEIRFCNTKSLNNMFDKAITLLGGIQSGSHAYYRYIEYDNRAHGLHNKIYSWIWDSGKKQECAKDWPTPILFPKDVSWQFLGKIEEKKL